MKAAYKLDEYRVLEDENGLLCWETHHGFGEQRRGMCFIHNDILILGPCTHEEIGYLKGEFLDGIAKLPPWNKTKSYCFASELMDVASGRDLNDDFPDWVFYCGSKGSGREISTTDRRPGTFQLGKYLLTVESDGQVSWQAHMGMNKVIAGQCTIESGVLFIHPEGQEKEEHREGYFFKKIDTSPKWDRTKIWCRGFVLRFCRAQAESGSTKPSRGRAERRAIRTFFGDPAAKGVQQAKGLVRIFSGFSFGSWKPMWNRLHVPSRRKFYKLSWLPFHEPSSWLKRTVAVADLISGIISTLVSAEKRSQLFRSSDRHHRK